MPWGSLFSERNSAFLGPVPHNPYFVATNTELAQSLSPAVLFSFHRPVSSVKVAVPLLSPSVPV